MSKIRANGECSILYDICPYYEKEHPCPECSLFQEYQKHKKMVEKYWEEENVRNCISEEAENLDLDYDSEFWGEKEDI